MTDSYRFDVTGDMGKRLDSLIAETVEDISRSRAQKLIEDGLVKINGEVVTSKKQKPAKNDIIDIEIPEPETLSVEPEDIPLDIVYEDDDVIVINKPKGMVVHPAPGNYTGTLVNALLFHEKGKLSSINGVARPGIVHRIDKDTSGLIMVAKNDNAHRELSRQLFDHSVTRRYVALVRDNLKDDEGTIDKEIGRDRKDRKKRGIDGSNPKPAVTHYKVLERFGMSTFVELKLETGRTHQIRVHMAYIKHPLIGDSLYGSGETSLKTPGGNVTIPEGQMLHAGVLGFKHPVTGEYMEFKVDPPEDFMKVIAALRK